MKRALSNLLRVRRRWLRRPIAFSGFPPGTGGHTPLDSTPDKELTILNQLLPWHAFVADAQGRRFGDIAWTRKRSEPQTIPDPRILMLNERFRLSGKSVLEIGCFEGIHTVGLCQLGADVIAIDARMENVAKTLLRAAMFDCWPRVYLQDIESTHDAGLVADICHHVGVLYHLKDPVGHLMELGRSIHSGIMLDTHVARPNHVDASYEACGRSWPYFRYRESGRSDPFSGMYDHAKWLPLDSLRQLLALAGFTEIELAEQREERNGLRVLVFARKKSG